MIEVRIESSGRSWPRFESRMRRPSSKCTVLKLRITWLANLAALMELPGLAETFRRDRDQNAALADYWEIVVAWDEQSRYALTSAKSAQDMFRAVTDPQNGMGPLRLHRLLRPLREERSEAIAFLLEHLTYASEASPDFEQLKQGIGVRAARGAPRDLYVEDAYIYKI